MTRSSTQKRYTRWRRPWCDRIGGRAVFALLAGMLWFAPVVLARDYEAGRKAYLDGDYAGALRILRPLAADGNSEAQKLLGVMYDYGHGVDRDPKEALGWYLKSAKQGDPAVQYQVGAKYFRGDGTGQNYQEAARWWEQAANGGQVDAQFNLGLMYFRGLSVAPDDRRAAELFGKAAAQGHGHAQYSLAVMHSTGRGVPKDYALARDLFEKAAAQNVSQAQFNLGVFYENGYGVERSLDTARAWYERAAASGLAEGRDKLAQLDATADASSIGHPDELRAATPARDASGTRVYDPRTDGPGMRAAAPEPERGPAPEPVAAAPAPPAASAAAAPEGDLRRENWVRAQNPGSFTLQIGSVTSEQAILSFIRDGGIAAEAGYVAVVIDGVTRYNALYGSYPSYAEAQRAAENLPPSLRDVKPWIRNFGILQKLLK
jgi:TPR repeat protein